MAQQQLCSSRDVADLLQSFDSLPMYVGNMRQALKFDERRCGRRRTKYDLNLPEGHYDALRL